MDNEVEDLENELRVLKRMKSELLRMRDMLTYFRRDIDGITVNLNSLTDINSAWCELAALASRVTQKQ